MNLSMTSVSLWQRTPFWYRVFAMLGWIGLSLVIGLLSILNGQDRIMSILAWLSAFIGLVAFVAIKQQVEVARFNLRTYLMIEPWRNFGDFEDWRIQLRKNLIWKDRAYHKILLDYKNQVKWYKDQNLAPVIDLSGLMQAEKELIAIKKVAHLYGIEYDPQISGSFNFCYEIFCALLEVVDWLRGYRFELW
ncbi:MAG: hypothetical protein R3B41_01280 [Candidatus Doudnabacteria bacterium]